MSWWPSSNLGERSGEHLQGVCYGHGSGLCCILDAETCTSQLDSERSQAEDSFLGGGGGGRGGTVSNGEHVPRPATSPGDSTVR